MAGRWWTLEEGQAYFTEGVLASASRWVHREPMEVHTHSFIEVAFVTGGEATHLSVAGQQHIETGDVIFLRPGVWHGYDCQCVELYNCAIRPELLYRELAWTHEDPVLG